MRAALEQAFKGQSVFVTGHTGFKGAWLLVMLEQLGARVTGYALPPETTPSGYAMIGGDKLCESVVGDLLDLPLLTRTLHACRPRFVLHLAAQSLVRRSYRDPVGTFHSNVIGTMNVLEVLRGYSESCATVVVTTDKVYAETGDGRPYQESDKLGGYDPYSTSKACCELVTESYRSSYFHPKQFASHGKAVATARAGNVIGGGDFCEDRLVPDVVRAMAAGESVRVRNPAAVRPWQHVLEPLTGYLQLAARLAGDPVQFSEGFNFGPGADDTLAVEQVVQIALRNWGSGQYHVDIDPSAPHEAALLRLDSGKAHQRLYWQPKYSAALAIERTIAWYRHAAVDPLAYTRGQVDEYLAA
ncbi:MAG TPA: CDP-glucose 4,6-dehydratase [Tepidisphaeraceae bacterium]|jgi:CDP-glucose 4,6-dehydratase